VVEAHRGTQGHQILYSVCNLRVPRDLPTEPRRCAEMGSFLHSVEDEMLCSSLMPDRVPYFNAPIYLQNKSVIGKVDEILGPINEVYFSVKMGEGMVANSFKKGDKVYIAGDKLPPIERFLPRPKVAGAWLSFSFIPMTGSHHANDLNRRH
jgi:H/ACA ribonucleoprotein complex subunit 1